MPGYVNDALKRFKRERPKRLQHQPHPHVPPNYGAKKQYAEEEDLGPVLGKDEIKFVQQVLGTFMYYARAVDSTILVALSAIATEQQEPTKKTLERVNQFLDYCASNDNAILTYKPSDMVLAVHSDASYLSVSKARSRAGGHFFLSDNEEHPPDNGAVLSVAQIIKAVMASATEAKIGAMFVNAREAVPVRKTLEEMGHPQPPTPMQTDNSAAHAVVGKNVQPRRLKAMDMRFHWLRCRDAQGQFRFFWRPGDKNRGDYLTKHFPGSHHADVRYDYLTPPRYLEDLRRRKELAGRQVELAQAIFQLQRMPMMARAPFPATRVC